MASNPSTPDKKSRQTRLTTTSSSESLHTALRVLTKNHIFIDNLAAGTRGADLIERAKTIVKGKRKSALKKEQGLALRATANEYAFTDALTFLFHIWSDFFSIKATRLVKTTADGELEDEDEVMRWIETAWEKDHLRYNWNADFTRGSIPPLVNLDPYLRLPTDNVPKVKNPKPDLTYGLLQASFSEHEQDVNSKHGAGLLVDMVHPFFVVEAKSAEKPIWEATNQCARGGAAMVRLKRKFDRLAEGTYQENEAQDGEEGDYLAGEIPHNKEAIPIDHYRTDTKSFAFSLAMVPYDATMFVHWAEEAFSKEGKLLTINWHATHIAHYFLNEEQDWIDLHHDMDNVLDWGTLKGKQELEELCKKIWEREQSRKKQKT